MLSSLMVSNVILWLVVLVLAVVVFALMRQIGVLHERVFPAGALMTTAGPMVGDPAPVIDLVSWSDKPLHIGGKHEEGLSTLILFVSPSCPICKTLLPLIDSVIRSESKSKPIQVILASDGARSEHEKFIVAQNISVDNYVLSQPLGLSYLVEKLPFAVLIDEQGIIKAKGLVNSREHLESLFEAREQNVASLQEYFMKEGANYEAA